MIAQRDAIAAWARITYGWLGRSPDYKAAFINTLGANADFYGQFADNARAWYKRGQEDGAVSSIMRSSIRRSIATSRLSR